MQSINPATEKVEAEFEPHTPGQVDEALDAASAAFEQWRKLPVARRAARVQALGECLRRHKAKLASLITAEMGKPIEQSRAEIEKCAMCCDYFAEQGPAFVAETTTEGASAENLVTFEPIGPVLAVMPWNFPFWQLIRFAAPTFVAGNTIVMKHASNVPRCALAIEDLVREAGFPEGALRTLLISGSEVAAVIADDRIKAVTFTGSETAGASVAEHAGRNLKKSVLELGGSDPFIVLADADLDAAVAGAVEGRFLKNSGQACNASKRFIVVDAVAKRFTDRFVRATAKLRVGDPKDSETQIGPLARNDLRETLNEQVAKSVEMGAHVRTGGGNREGKGFYFEPTILSGVRPGMPAFDEETFGPVATVTVANDADEAIALANMTQYGLSASIWSADAEAARSLADRIEAGTVFINTSGASDPRMPFGGVKRSGYGRELSAFGLREFVNIKSLGIGAADGATGNNVE